MCEDLIRDLLRMKPVKKEEEGEKKHEIQENVNLNDFEGENVQILKPKKK